MKKDPNRSPVSASTQTKQLKQRIWKIKSELVKKRLMDLSDSKTTNNKKIKEGFVDKRVICCQPKERSTNDLHSCNDASLSSAMDRAQEIKDNLPLNSPSFVKNMLRSHVTLGFWLGLPKKFCDEHLPEHDETVILVVENEEYEHKTNYLAEKRGLSAGWRGFSISHKLAEGDVCVFQLIEPCKFKVHIVRESALTEVASTCPFAEDYNASLLPEVTAARSLINLHDDPIETVELDEDHEELPKGNGVVLDITPLQSRKPSEPNHKPKKRKIIILDNSSDSDEQFVPETTSHAPSFPESPLDFKDVKTFEDFKIQVNGTILHSEISTHLRQKYYQLCCSQKRFLHENLVKGLNGNLASGVISETITISDAIQTAQLSMGLDELERYDKTLKAFEELGMVVGFLRARINKLSSLSQKLEEKLESKKNERNEAVELITGLKVRLAAVERLKMKLDDDIGELLKNRKEDLFTQMAGEPW